MRLSVNKNDPGYSNLEKIWDKRSQLFVMLDGEIQARVIVADEEEGFVEKYMVCEKGLVIVENGELLREKLEGKVEITYPGREEEN